MNLPLVIGGAAAVFFLMSSSKKSKPVTNSTQENLKNQKSEEPSEVGKFYNINDPSTFNKKYLLDQRGYVIIGCEITITNQNKMYDFAFEAGKKFKQSEWVTQIFDGCDFLNRILDPETMYYFYEIYRNALSGAVKAKKLGSQQAISTLYNFRKKLKDNGFNVSKFYTFLINK